jgi:AAA+ ATPase superfamily predicted ATPase
MFYNHDEELSFLNEIYVDLSAGELIVIYGRRRVGKT